MPSSLSLFYENTVGALFEHSAGYAVLVYHAGPRLPADLHMLLVRSAELLRRNDWRKAITDQRLMRPFLPSEIAGILAFWQAEVEQRNIHFYAATLVSDNVFAQLAIYPLVYQMPSSAITYRSFNEEDIAAAWLQQQGGNE